MVKINKFNFNNNKINETNGSVVSHIINEILYYMKNIIYI